MSSFFRNRKDKFNGILTSVFIFCLIFEGFTQSDSLLSPNKFFEAVARNHPLVKQAGLFISASEMEVLESRGQFDPKLLARFNRKSFDGTEYYNLFNPEIKVTTLPGIDLKAGFERNTGVYVNGEDNTPQSGLQYLGIGIPLVQGMITDARRTTLKQAKIGVQMAEAEKQKQVNIVLFSAAKDYWEWYFKKQELLNAEFAYRLSNERFQAVQQRIIVGDLASIDSVEARIFLQDREIFRNQSRIDELNSRLLLSTYLWSDDEKPLDIANGVSPEIPPSYLSSLSDSLAKKLMDLASLNHPEIRKISLKADILILDRRLSSEMLKPQLNFNYSWLSRTDKNVWATNSIDRNYKLGLDFSFPVFLRKERGKLGLVKTKIIQNSLNQIQTSREILMEIKMGFNELKNLEKLLVMQTQMVDNYQKLRNAEIRKFENGESSLFLINSREAKLIEALIKQASLMSKYQKERASLFYSAGRNPLLPLP